MVHDQENLIMTTTRPKRRWFQFGLKSLFVLPVVVGILLAAYLYWDDWRRQRPPYRAFDFHPFDVAYQDFVEDLRAGRFGYAYESTSPRFKKHMSRSDVEAMIRRDLSRSLRQPYRIRCSSIRRGAELKNWLTAIYQFQGEDTKAMELWVWVVMDDSFFNRRPPIPRVEDIQIREVVATNSSEQGFAPDLPPRWVQK
jgi:hypothetical protein